MHMVVLTKDVPDFWEGQVSFDEDGHLKRGKTPTMMNPNGRFALEAALQMRARHGGRVSVMNMGPPGYKEVLQEAMETMYASDLHLVSDREMVAADTWAAAITLSGGIETLGEPDVVFAGFKTADGGTGHIGPQTNRCLGIPLVTHVVSLDTDGEAGTLRAKRLVEGDIEETETVETELPAFVVADPEFEPSYRTTGERLTLKDLREETRARTENYKEHLTVWDHADINVDPDYVGLDGPPTITSSIDPIPKASAERETTMVDPDGAGAMQDMLTAMQSAMGDGDGDTAAAEGD